MNLNHPEATAAALALLRNGSPFQWYVITLLALVIYIYANEISNKNWNSIAAGLSLYMVHWFVEIVNGLVQHFSGHALWSAWNFRSCSRWRGLSSASCCPTTRRKNISG